MFKHIVFILTITFLFSFLPPPTPPPLPPTVHPYPAVRLENQADTEFIHSTVAIKSLHTFFSAFQHPPRDILLSVFKNEMVVLFVSNDDYNIYCYVPMRAED